MSDHLHAIPLHRSPTVTIYDVRCRPHDRHCGPEEFSSENHIVFPRVGSFVRHVAGQQLVADPNQVLFFRKDEPYRVAHPCGGDDCTVFAFAPAVLIEGVQAYQPRVENPDQPFEFTSTESDESIFLNQQRLRQRALNPNRDELALDELSLDFLAALVRAAYQSRGVKRDRRRGATLQAHRVQAEKTRLLLSGRFSENLALADIARAVHCSAFHLTRLFRDATGLPIHRYRNRLRLRAGLERIIAGESDLTRLALDLGFSSHSHFTDLFRKAFGETPSDCRRRGSTRRLRELSKNLKVAENLFA